MRKVKQGGSSSSHARPVPFKPGNANKLERT